MKSYISIKDYRQRRFMAVLTVINIVIFLASCFMFYMSARNYTSRQPSKATEPTTAKVTTASKTKTTSKKTTKTSSKASAAKKKATTAPTEKPTQKPTETQAPKPTEPAIAEVSEELSAILTESGYGAEDLKNVRQLVTVQSDYSNPSIAAIRLFEVTNGKWAENEGMFCYGYVSSDGTVSEMSEQTSGTPQGLYGVGEAFYQGTAPKTGLKSFKITNNTYWIDDPTSKYYNQRVEGEANKDWSSAVHMIDSPLYEYGFVINYNTPAVPGAGSAIFFHVGSEPTSGGVATGESGLLGILRALKSSSHPRILIH